MKKLMIILLTFTMCLSISVICTIVFAAETLKVEYFTEVIDGGEDISFGIKFNQKIAEETSVTITEEEALEKIKINETAVSDLGSDVVVCAKDNLVTVKAKKSLFALDNSDKVEICSGFALSENLKLEESYSRYYNHSATQIDYTKFNFKNFMWTTSIVNDMLSTKSVSILNITADKISSGENTFRIFFDSPIIDNNNFNSNSNFRPGELIFYNGSLDFLNWTWAPGGAGYTFEDWSDELCKAIIQPAHDAVLDGMTLSYFSLNGTFMEKTVRELRDDFLTEPSPNTNFKIHFYTEHTDKDYYYMEMAWDSNASGDVRPDVSKGVSISIDSDVWMSPNGAKLSEDFNKLYFNGEWSDIVPGSAVVGSFSKPVIDENTVDFDISFSQNIGVNDNSGLFEILKDKIEINGFEVKDIASKITFSSVGRLLHVSFDKSLFKFDNNDSFLVKNGIAFENGVKTTNDFKQYFNYVSGIWTATPIESELVKHPVKSAIFSPPIKNSDGLVYVQIVFENQITEKRILYYSASIDWLKKNQAATGMSDEDLLRAEMQPAHQALREGIVFNYTASNGAHIEKNIEQILNDAKAGEDKDLTVMVHVFTHSLEIYWREDSQQPDISKPMTISFDSEVWISPNGCVLKTDLQRSFDPEKNRWSVSGYDTEIEWDECTVESISKPFRGEADNVTFSVYFDRPITQTVMNFINCDPSWLVSMSPNTDLFTYSITQLDILSAYGVLGGLSDNILFNGETLGELILNDKNPLTRTKTIMIHIGAMGESNRMDIIFCGINDDGSNGANRIENLDGPFEFVFKKDLKMPIGSKTNEDVKFIYNAQNYTFVKAEEEVSDNCNVKSVFYNGNKIEKDGKLNLPYTNSIDPRFFYVALEDPSATYTIEGLENLKEGANTITIKVTASDKVTTGSFVFTLEMDNKSSNGCQSNAFAESFAWLMLLCPVVFILAKRKKEMRL